MRSRITLIFGAIFVNQVLGEYGMAHFSDQGVKKGKDYCIFFNSQWARLPQDLHKASRLQIHDLTTSVLCSPSEVPEGGVPQPHSHGAQGTPPAGNKTQYDEIDIPSPCSATPTCWTSAGLLGRGERLPCTPRTSCPGLQHGDHLPNGRGNGHRRGYWAGSRDTKKRYMKHKKEHVTEKQDEETVDVTSVMICVFVVMCCTMLVLLYLFYDQLVYLIIAVFCLASAIGLYSCLWPLVRRNPPGGVQDT
ncbi:hypothetical protein SKAU_G00119850 [Synaphobranchus kaupii]|uniref:Uncharacterized protein n=1 Tax=Synaphobranchus kaupii TaxID=118154 RepID=A0A9Q1J1B1_SYNKA|nr:hypothetical protein SKAU_G00119850 [Synaphobranchus kaupii]